MKILISFFLLLLSTNNSDCNKFRIGKFEIESKFGGKILIERTENFQTETLTRNGNVTRYKIKWKSKCSYMLFDRKLLKGKEEINDTIFREKLNKDTILCNIIDVKGDESRVVSKMGNFPDLFESIIRKTK
ncbi:hypothetical protein DI487_00170 [Flavobacterium sediminis]|uniref:Lipocalin-like domain-containing protein n=1 Tax=Flavobacterium sediminis TaxID=2201181 RepID=A0A2U8QQU7_9FLAO|nr:hypothetical protein [Flavobacterium sediminis]AWM12447.1 hypothetical protein DI487_00170 [Flavobacterium sediminis]